MLLSFLYVACVVGAFLLAKPLRNSLYLREYGPYALVYAYVAVPLVLSIFVPIHTAISRRIGTRLANFGTLIFFSLNVVGFWWGFRTGRFELLPAIFYVWVNCFGVIAPVHAWSFATALFDARQAKRLFGLVGAGASFGAIAGGLLARFLVEPVGGTVNLLLVLAALILMAAAIVAFASSRLTRRHSVPRAVRRAQRFSDTLREIGSSRYLRLVAALVVLVAIVTQWIAFQLSVVAAQRFGDDVDALTRFFGEFNFILGAVGFVLQLLLTAKALRVFGVGSVILILPVALAFGSALTVLFPVFLAVLLTNAADQSLRFSADKAAYELLYLPLPPGLRTGVKNTLDILANRVGDAAGGVLLGLATGGFLLPGAGLGIRGTAALTFVLAVGWIAVAWQLRRAYVAAIGESIHRYRVDLERGLVSNPHETLDDVMTQKLASGDAGDVRDALTALLRVKRPKAYAELHRLLHHPAADVKRDALAVLSRSGDRSAAAAAEALLRDPDLGVRTQALLYLSKEGGFDPLQKLEQLGAFEDFSIRAATVAVLAGPGPARNSDAARILLEHMARSDEARDRAEAARLMALLDDPPARLLADLIADPDDDVARQAIQTAETKRQAANVEALLVALARPSVSADVVTALAACGEAVVPLLEAALSDRELPLDARREVPAVLVRIGSAGARRALIAGLLDADAPLRQRVISSLNKLQERHPAMRVDETALELLLAAEIAGHYRSYQVLAPLQKGEKIAAALRHSMDQELERIFRLIALLSPTRALHDAYVGVRSPNPLVRANALEYLDNVLKPELRSVLLPLIDVQVTDAERAALGEQLLGAPLTNTEEAVTVLLASGDPWLRSRAEIAFHRLNDAPASEIEQTPVPASMHSSVGAG